MLWYHRSPRFILCALMKQKQYRWNCAGEKFLLTKKNNSNYERREVFTYVH